MENMMDFEEQKKETIERFHRSSLLLELCESENSKQQADNKKGPIENDKHI